MGAPHDERNGAAPEDTARVARARNLVVAGAALCVAGIGLAGSLSRGVGGLLTAIGWLVLVAGIHSFGRLGTR